MVVLSDTNTALEWEEPMKGRSAGVGERTTQLTKELFDCQCACHEFPINKEFPIGTKTSTVT